MKLSIVLFSLLVGMCLALGVVLMSDAPPGAAGVPHPDYPSMLRGGDGEARLAPVRFASWTMGLLQITFFVALLAFGAWRKVPFPFERRVLWVGAAVYAAFYLAMVLAYDAYATAGSGSLVLSFPVPTAFMLYGVGFAPCIFIALYLFRFTPWILSDEDLERFLRDARAGDE